MNPEEALQRSELRTIRAAIQNGVAIIHRSAAASGSFHARTVGRDRSGQLRMAAMQVVGDFNSLVDAIAAVHNTIGHEIRDWEPDIGIEIRLNDDGGMQPTAT